MQQFRPLFFFANWIRFTGDGAGNFDRRFVLPRPNIHYNCHARHRRHAEFDGRRHRRDRRGHADRGAAPSRNWDRAPGTAGGGPRGRHACNLDIPAQGPHGEPGGSVAGLYRAAAKWHAVPSGDA